LSFVCSEQQGKLTGVSSGDMMNWMSCFLHCHVKVILLLLIIISSTSLQNGGHTLNMSVYNSSEHKDKIAPVVLSWKTFDPNRVRFSPPKLGPNGCHLISVRYELGPPGGPPITRVPLMFEVDSVRGSKVLQQAMQQAMQQAVQQMYGRTVLAAGHHAAPAPAGTGLAS
jgi:hypothetical protein